MTRLRQYGVFFIAVVVGVALVLVFSALGRSRRGATGA